MQRLLLALALLALAGCGSDRDRLTDPTDNDVIVDDGSDDDSDDGSDDDVDGTDDHDDDTDDGDDGSDDDDDSPPPPVDLDQSDADMLGAVGSAGLQAWATSFAMDATMLYLVEQASILNGGRPTTTGALTATASGGWAYSPTPTDRLRLFGPEGSADLFITCFEGDVSGGLERLMYQHECFTYRYVVGGAEVRGSSRAASVLRSGNVESMDLTSTFSFDNGEGGRFENFTSAIRFDRTTVALAFGGRIVDGDDEIVFDDSWSLTALASTQLDVRVRLGSQLRMHGSRLAFDRGAFDLYLGDASGRLVVRDAARWSATGSALEGGHVVAELAFSSTPVDGSTAIPQTGLRERDGRVWPLDVLAIFGAFTGPGGYRPQRIAPPADLPQLPRVDDVIPA